VQANSISPNSTGALQSQRDLIGINIFKIALIVFTQEGQMKKLVLLVVLAFAVVCGMWTVDCFSADIKGKLGVGANYPGLQVRYGITDNILVEGRAQFALNNITVGAGDTITCSRYPEASP